MTVNGDLCVMIIGLMKMPMLLVASLDFYPMVSSSKTHTRIGALGVGELGQ